MDIDDEKFYDAMRLFHGASKRLELVEKNEYTNIYKDFAHSPSKLKATTQAVKEQFPERHLVACLELHTFSSLTAEFLKEYKGAMQFADIACVYFNPHTIEHKKLPPITKEQVLDAFSRNDIRVYTQSDILVSDLLKMNWQDKNLLLMSSGNFDGVNFSQLASQILSK